MSRKDIIKRAFGEEFIAYEPSDRNTVDVVLQLQSVCSIDLLEDIDRLLTAIPYERNRMLITMKQELDELLQKYLGKYGEEI